MFSDKPGGSLPPSLTSTGKLFFPSVLKLGNSSVIIMIPSPPPLGQETGCNAEKEVIARTQKMGWKDERRRREG